MGARKVEDLRVRHNAIDLTAEVYKTSRKLPRVEPFALASQTQRAAASIPGSIAEGFTRAGSKDKARFYKIGRASAEELRTSLVLLPKLGYSPAPPALFAPLDELCAMLHRLWEVVFGAQR